jgi:hypothetical protein
MMARDPLRQRISALAISLALGLACYWGLGAIGGGALPMIGYERLIAGMAQRLPNQLAWFVMNFAEPQFYAGIFSGLGVILGGVVAWWLYRRGKQIGFPICGNADAFPWVLASQLGSLALTLFVFGRFADWFDGTTAWVATFIPVVSAPPAVILLCGTGWRQLLGGTILGGLLCAPAAMWLNIHVTTPLGLPGVVASVTAMAIVGAVVCSACSAQFGTLATATPEPERRDIAWRVRRTLADFSEAQFYGNEIASGVLLMGVILEWMLCAGHGAYGSGLIPAILLSQFTGSAVGVFLYGERITAEGYATFVPVVSVGPACVLFYGGGLLPALFAGALGGILGAPTAAMFRRHLPGNIHPTVANVSAMALCTALVAAGMELLPWFSRI